MTVVLNPEQERILSEAVRSGLAHTAGEALDQAFEALRSRLLESLPASVVQTDEERAQAFEKWARSHPERPPLPESAFQRENLIRDVG